MMPTLHTNKLDLDRVLTDTTDVDELANQVKDQIMIDIAMTVDLDNFLADPIGYGDFDYLDPITLTDFEVERHMHGLYIEPLT